MVWLRRLNTAALLLCFVVVVFGAYVRLSGAGLSCPDWPTCYGHLTVPDAASDPHASWKEMIHRYLAMTLGLLIAAQALFTLVARQGRKLAWTLVPLVGAQAWLGKLTVSELLKPLIVTGHLIGGMTTFALLLWLWWSLRTAPAATVAASTRSKPFRSDREVWVEMKDQAPVSALPSMRKFAALGLALVALQIFLGGWTSSNYAATACPDFPTCQGRWLPPDHFGEAFTLWHGLDRSYEGGVLESPARQTIQVVHRFGAGLVTLVTLALAAVALSRGARWRSLGMLVTAALVAQILIGIGLVKLQFPLLVAAAHNAGAALLLAALVSLNFFAWNPERAA